MNIDCQQILPNIVNSQYITQLYNKIYLNFSIFYKIFAYCSVSQRNIYFLISIFLWGIGSLSRIFYK